MHDFRSRVLRAAALLALAVTLAAPVRATSRTSHSAVTPAHLESVDFSQRLDANSLGLVLSNLGSFGYDLTSGAAGLEYPLGSGKTALFAGGLWLGAVVNGSPRVTTAEYAMEFGPGALLPGPASDVHTKPEYKVYKLLRQYPDGATRDAALADYRAGAVPHGAPRVTVLGDGTLGILGDRMLWSVYNDADVSLHNGSAGSTAPLGVEVRQTSYAFSASGALSNTALLRFQIRDGGAQALDSMYVALWLDPDLGGFSDDLVGCDAPAGMGYCYNATNTDAIYGTQPPALGIDLVQGPAVYAGGPRLGATAFVHYVNGSDPTSAASAYDRMRGLNTGGFPIIDPTTSSPTTFVFSGDPVTQTGWLDTSPADKRMMLSSGPVHLGPGESTDILVALMVGQGTNRLSSISALRSVDASVQAQFGGQPALGVGPATAPGAVLAVAIGPNPVHGECSVAFRLPQAAPASLEVFDVHGRRTAGMALGTLAAGPHTNRLELNGAPDGLYFVRLVQGGRSGWTRMVVAR